MILSIIVTSQNRPVEFRRFIDSINSSQGINFNDLQIIFVDQGNNKELFSRLDDRIDSKYIPSARCSLSKARNKALPYVKGKYIGLGDDDCWYSSRTIEQILLRFKEGYDGLIAHAKNETGKNFFSSDPKTQLISINHRFGVISFCIFLKYDNNLYFDENLGVGSPYRLSSGEETDYLITYMERHPNSHILYDSAIVVYHPIGEKGNFANNSQKSYEYARGDGRVMKKHKSITFLYRAIAFGRPLIGILYYLITGRFERSKHSYLLFKGRIEGYSFKF